MIEEAVRFANWILTKVKLIVLANSFLFAKLQRNRVVRMRKEAAHWHLVDKFLQLIGERSVLAKPAYARAKTRTLSNQNGNDESGPFAFVGNSREVVFGH